MLCRRKPLVVKTVICSQCSVLKGLFTVKSRKKLIFELELNRCNPPVSFALVQSL